MTNEEKRCYEMLDFLRQQYIRDAQPYIDILVSIERNRLPQPILIDIRSVHPVAIDALGFPKRSNIL